MQLGPGTYYANGATLSVEEPNGKLCVIVKWSITHMGSPSTGKWDDLPQAEERSTWWYMTTDGCRAVTAERLKAIGFNGDFKNPVAILPGGGVQLIAAYEEYQGKQRLKFDIAKPERESKPAAQDTITRMQAWWRATQAAAAGKPPAPKPVAPPPAAPPPVAPPAMQEPPPPDDEPPLPDEAPPTGSQIPF